MRDLQAGYLKDLREAEVFGSVEEAMNGQTVEGGTVEKNDLECLYGNIPGAIAKASQNGYKVRIESQ